MKLSSLIAIIGGQSQDDIIPRKEESYFDIDSIFHTSLVEFRYY
jgi:hypothetical protein